MKKSTTAILIIYALICIVAITLIVILIQSKDTIDSRNQRIIELGTDYCKGNHIDNDILCTIAPTGYCAICNKIQLFGGVLCKYCAANYNRCQTCGKLLK